jgi:hypothetical protein
MVRQNRQTEIHYIKPTSIPKLPGVLAGHILTIQAIFAQHPEATDSSRNLPGCEALAACHMGAVHGSGDQASPLNSL